MATMTLIWGFLLFSGFFVVDTSPQVPSANMINTATNDPKTTTHTPNTTTHAPNTTTHAPNTTTHAPNTTTHAPNTTTHTPNTTTHAPNTTTHAPNTTTHAPNTTTHAPNTTTHAPNTTTHAPNTTTHAPNTTTHAPNTTTTIHVTTHATPTLPPKPSPPEIGNYTVKDGKVCIIADMGLELQIDNSTKQSTDRRYFNIEPKHTNANGACGDSTSKLVLQFPEGSIDFTFVKESKIYYIEEVSVQFYMPSAGRWNGTSGKLKLLSTDVGYAVRCKRTPTVKLGDNLELILAEVKLQAFEIQNGTFGKEEICSYDRNFTAVAIAVVIIVLIVIAMLIYFIWHKRRSSGYQRI